MSKLVGSIVGRKGIGLKTTGSELGDCDGVLVFGGPEGEELGTIEGAGVRATKSNTLTCPVQSGISSGEHLCASVT